MPHVYQYSFTDRDIPGAYAMAHWDKTVEIESWLKDEPEYLAQVAVHEAVHIEQLEAHKWTCDWDGQKWNCGFIPEWPAGNGECLAHSAQLKYALQYQSKRAQDWALWLYWTYGNDDCIERGL